MPARLPPLVPVNASLQMLIQVTSENLKHVYITQTLGGRNVWKFFFQLWTCECSNVKVHFGAALSMGYPVMGTKDWRDVPSSLPLGIHSGFLGTWRVKIQACCHTDTSLCLPPYFLWVLWQNFLGHSKPWAASNNFARLASQLYVLLTGQPKLCGGLSTETKKSILEESHLFPQAMFS